jgi:hypothetical protein
MILEEIDNLRVIVEIRIEAIQYEAGSSVKSSAWEYCRKSPGKCVFIKV